MSSTTRSQAARITVNPEGGPHATPTLTIDQEGSSHEDDQTQDSSETPILGGLSGKTPSPSAGDPNGFDPGGGSTTSDEDNDDDRLTASDLCRLIKELRKDNKNSGSNQTIKVNTPKEFSGAKRDECETFISACQLYFHAKKFKRDEDKVTFAGSYLIGAARRWFNTYSDEHELMNDWSKFVKELTRRHGEQDPKGSAIRKLEGLSMRNTDHVSDFLVKFTEYQSHIHWEDGAGSALAVRFYDMLPIRIKETMTIGGRRHLKMDLYELQDAATDIDNDYWNFRLANQLELRADHALSRNDTRSSKDRKACRPTLEPRATRNDRSNNCSSATQYRSPPLSGSNSEPQSTKRGLDATDKLTPKENRRRFKNNLRLICADPGHRRADCPKRMPRPAGRFKKVTTTFTIAANPSGQQGN